MADILFSHSYFQRFDPKQWNLRKPYPPLGTLYAASLMREDGFSVALFDTMFAHGPEELLPYLERENPRYLVLYDDGFNYLTKMCLTNMREAAFRMCEMARDRGIKVFVCSSDSTDQYEKYLAHGATAVILGEGEMGLQELIQRSEKGENDWSGLLGIAYMTEGEVTVNAKRPVLRDLDTLPPPAWDLIDIRPYQEAWKIHGYFSINMATTRGCPYKCNWCAKPIYGNRYHSHSPESKAAELEMLMRNFGATHVWFCDDIFGLKPGWVQAFSDEVNKRGLKFRFMIQSRVDLLLKEDTIEALAKAGCDTVWLGAESGSQRILDAMDKGTTVDQIKEARRKLKKYGVKTAFFLQFGYLGETQEDVEKTFEMLRQTLPDDIGVSVAYPLPGTPFYEKVKSDLSAKTNWTDSDDLAMMFRNTYSPAYYRRLHRYVHKRYRKMQAFEGLRNLLRMHISGQNLYRAASSAWYLPATMVEKAKLNRLYQHG